MISIKLYALLDIPNADGDKRNWKIRSVTFNLSIQRSNSQTYPRTQKVKLRRLKKSLESTEINNPKKGNLWVEAGKQREKKCPSTKSVWTRMPVVTWDIRFESESARPQSTEVNHLAHGVGSSEFSVPRRRAYSERKNREREMDHTQLRIALISQKNQLSWFNKHTYIESERENSEAQRTSQCWPSSLPEFHGHLANNRSMWWQSRLGWKTQREKNENRKKRLNYQL